MTNCAKKGDPVTKTRNRSSSANEASKPITMTQRWPTHAGKKHDIQFSSLVYNYIYIYILN